MQYEYSEEGHPPNMDRAMRGTILLSLLICSVSAHANVSAQTIDPNKAITQLLLDRWGYEEGLPQNSVPVVLQTEDGYLWLGTEEGLARFDGRDFKIFDQSNTTAFETSQSILDLLEDSDGTLWIGTQGGGLLSYTDGIFSTYLVSTGPVGESVSTIVQSTDGTLWVGTWDAGLYACTRVGCDQFDEDGGVTGNKIQKLVVDDEGAVWVGTERGLFFSPPGGARSFSSVHAFDGEFVQTMYLESGNSLLVSTKSRFARITDGDTAFLTPAEGWPVETVWSIHEDRSGSLWLGLGSGGLVRVHEGHFDFFGEEDGLSPGTVLDLYEDREGSLWIGLAYGGLNRLRDAAFTTWSETEGLVANTVTTIFEDENGTVWVGTFGGGVSRLLSDEIQSFTAADGLSADFITSISGADGTVWIGTLDDGLNRLRNGRIRKYTIETGLPSNSVYSLFNASDGSLWIGTDAGLTHIEDSGITTFAVEDGLPGNSVTAIAEDQDGVMWIGTYESGLAMLSNGRFTTFTTADGIGHNTISALHIDGSGTVWIGTHGGGLTRYRDGLFVTFTMKNGMFDDKVFQILEDDSGYLWMGCNRGIFRVAKSDFEAVALGQQEAVFSDVFGTDDGLKSREINGGVQPAGWKGKDGRLWFPTVAGVVVVDPEDLRRNEAIPPVVVQEVLVDTVPVNLRSQIELAPGTKRIEIRYAGLSLVDPSAVRYRYMLEGDEDEWIDAGDQRNATYTHLDPGSYTFRVAATNNDGVWNEVGTTLQFSVVPFFYQLPLFWVACAFLVIGLFVMGHGVRVRSLTARKRQLEEMVETRTRDVQAAKEIVEARTDALRSSLREKDVLLREVHHRVKNNLQMISSLLQLQSQHIEDEATRALFKECRDRIYSISMIHERLYQSDDLAELDFGAYLTAITDQLQRSYDTMSDNITLNVNSEVDDLGVDQAIPCGLIMTELVSNALRHAFSDGSRGTIDVTFKREDARYEMTVEDDGCGLPADFEIGTGSTLGLNLVHALVDRLGGTIQVSGLSSGSRFQVSFPRDRSAKLAASSIDVDEIEYV